MRKKCLLTSRKEVLESRISRCESVRSCSSVGRERRVGDEGGADDGAAEAGADRSDDMVVDDSSSYPTNNGVNRLTSGCQYSR